MRTLLTLLTALVAAPAQAEPDLVILVRHAERAAEPAGDPGLTPAGQRRAQALAAALADAGVTAIVTSTAHRTQATAAPLAQARGLTPIVVATAGPGPGHVPAVAEAVRALSGTVLVVGHSNTVPAVITALGGPALPALCETQFGLAFVWRPAGGGLLRLRYGGAEVAAATGCL